MFTSSYRLSKLEQTSHCRKRSYVDPYVYSLCYSEGGLWYLCIAEGRYPSSRSSSLGIHPFLVLSKDFFYLGPNYQTVLGQCVSSTLSSPTILRGLEYRHISGELAWSISQPQGVGQLPTRADISMDWPSQLFSELCISLPCYIASQDEWGSVLS